MNPLRHVGDHWQAGEYRRAYEAACDLPEGVFDMLDVFPASRTAGPPMTLRGLVAGCCREVVDRDDPGWVRKTLAGGRTPPLAHQQDAAKDAAGFAAQRRRAVAGMLRAAGLVLGRQAVAADPARSVTREEVAAAAASAGVPPGWMRDAVRTLMPGVGRGGPAAGAGTSRGLLVENGVTGRLATVRCEVVADGTGAAYPHPDLAFAVLDDGFAGSVRAAWHFAQAARPGLDGHDLRWHVALHPEGTPEWLYDTSLGAALSLAAARAAAGCP